MRELDVVISGSASPPRICALPYRLAIKNRLRFVHVDLCDAAATSPAVYLGLLVVQIIVCEFHRVCGFAHALLG